MWAKLILEAVGILKESVSGVFFRITAQFANRSRNSMKNYNYQGYVFQVWRHWRSWCASKTDQNTSSL